MRRRNFRLLILATLCSLLGSCSQPAPRLPVNPVTGKVSYQGKPAAGALVVFCPREESKPKSPRPYGTVAPDGTFSLTTYEPGDGAPAGEYIVLLEWRKSSTNEEAEEEESPDLFGGRYADPAKSPLRATITEGLNTLKPIELR